MRWSPLPFAVSVMLAALSISVAQEAADETDSKPVVSLNPLSDLDLESLEATRSAPLFTPSRKAPVVPEPEPVEVAAAEPPPAPPPPPLQLVGVIMSGSTDIALFRDRSTKEVIRLSSGGVYNGWSIHFVDSRTVEFRNGDQTESLTMFDEFEAVSDAGGGPGSAPSGFPPDFTGTLPGGDPVSPGDQSQFDQQFGAPSAEDTGGPMAEDFGGPPVGPSTYPAMQFSDGRAFYPDQAFDEPPTGPEGANPEDVTR